LLGVVTVSNRAHSGRCFRARRRTAERKRKQVIHLMATEKGGAHTHTAPESTTSAQQFLKGLFASMDKRQVEQRLQRVKAQAARVARVSKHASRGH
jgi:hypothetical protein